MNDPLSVVHSHTNEKIQKAMRDQQAKDIADGNCVKSPGPDYHLAEKPDRVRCVAFAKRLAVAGQWVGKIEAKVYEFFVVDAQGNRIIDEKNQPIIERVHGWDAQVTFGHWWLKK